MKTISLKKAAAAVQRAQDDIDKARARRNIASADFVAAVRYAMDKHGLTASNLIARLPGWKYQRLMNFMHLNYILTPKEADAIVKAASKPISK